MASVFASDPFPITRACPRGRHCVANIRRGLNSVFEYSVRRDVWTPSFLKVFRKGLVRKAST